MELRRQVGWERRLCAFLAENRHTPFVWGAWDCATVAIRGVELLTGQRVWTITWASAIDARRVIADAGGLATATSSRLGQPSQNWRVLRRGDIGLVDMDGRAALTICTGQALCGPGIDRIEHLPVSAARVGWRVG